MGLICNWRSVSMTAVAQGADETRCNKTARGFSLFFCGDWSAAGFCKGGWVSFRRLSFVTLTLTLTFIWEGQAQATTRRMLVPGKKLCAPGSYEQPLLRIWRWGRSAAPDRLTGTRIRMQQRFPVTVQLNGPTDSDLMQLCICMGVLDSSSSLETAFERLADSSRKAAPGYRHAQCQQLEVSFLILPCHRWRPPIIESL